MDKVEPFLIRFLNERDEPKMVVSNKDKEDPNLPMPKTEMLEP
jgi:hypothetical protein